MHFLLHRVAKYLTLYYIIAWGKVGWKSNARTSSNPRSVSASVYPRGRKNGGKYSSSFGRGAVFEIKKVMHAAAAAN
jgi:hypothetical protein